MFVIEGYMVNGREPKRRVRGIEVVPIQVIKALPQFCFLTSDNTKGL